MNAPQVERCREKRKANWHGKMLAPQHQASAPQSMEMDAVGMDHLATRAALRRKRKAESQPENNERLSKRLSLLNLGKFNVCICAV
jgi:hypothetical protein